MKMNEQEEDFAWAGALALCLTIIVLALSGCASKDAPKADAIAPHEAAAVATGNCAMAVSNVATAATGDAVTKAYALATIERMCSQGQAHYAASAPPQTGWQTAWQGALQVADLFIRGYGIKTSRDVGLNASNNQTAQALGSYSAFGSIANSGFAANAAIATAPRAPGQVFNLDGSNGNSFGAGNANYSPISGSYNPVNPNAKQCVVVPATATTAATITCS